MANRLRRSLQALALLALSTLVAAACAEVVLRFFFPVAYMAPPSTEALQAWKHPVHRRSSIPGLAYDLNPGASARSDQSLVSINSQGMRDDEPLPAETPGLVRIAAVGDSFTFGLFVSEKEAYPRQLEEMLNREPGSECRYDVLNFGVSGYSSRDEALVLKHRALRWDPALVVVGYTLNDPEIDPIQPLQAFFAPVRWWQHLHLARQVAFGAREWAKWRYGDGNYHRYLHAPGRRKWRSVLDAFSQMSADAGKEGVPILLVIFPRPTKRGWDSYPHADLHDQVARAALQAGMEVIDLLETFREHAPRSLMNERTNSHPSPLAHRLAAERILREIRVSHPSILCGS